MGAHGFGRGEYKYFADPLPRAHRRAAPRTLSGASRRSPIDGTRRWAFLCAIPPSTKRSSRAAAAGQTRPTPLLLRYGEGDYNCLHQDVYGEHLFPLQVAILLSEPGRDFAGGEFVLTEQRPRMQSRAEVVSLSQGDGVIFAVRERPAQGTRGTYRVTMRHGVSRLEAAGASPLGSSSTTPCRAGPPTPPGRVNDPPRKACVAVGRRAAYLRRRKS